MAYKICKSQLTSGFCAEKYPAIKRLYHRKKKRESRYKSGKPGTKFEGRFQNVKLVYKTGISDDY